MIYRVLYNDHTLSCFLGTDKSFVNEFARLSKEKEVILIIRIIKK
jgi:hypothetical protein